MSKFKVGDVVQLTRFGQIGRGYVPPGVYTITRAKGEWYRINYMVPRVPNGHVVLHESEIEREPLRQAAQEILNDLPTS